MESIGTTLKKGFRTWTHNLNLCIPFFLNTIVQLFLIFLVFFLVTATLILPEVPGFADNPESLSPEEAMEIITVVFIDNIVLIGLVALFLTLVLGIIGAYFLAGAIGMAKQASETGTSSVGEMFRSGSAHFLNLFLTRVVLILIMLAGIIFVLPGFLSIGGLETFLEDPEQAVMGTLLLSLGIFIWFLYAIVVELIFTYSEYAVVAENLDPVRALERGFNVFMQNKFDTLIIWAVVIGIFIVLGVAGQLMMTMDTLVVFWSFAEPLISLVVIQPLVLIWWTRMFLKRTGNDVYDIDEYLEYPYP